MSFSSVAWLIVCLAAQSADEPAIVDGSDSGDEPELVAYLSPVVDSLAVKRRGGRAVVEVRLGRVSNATGYEIQISRSPSFTRLVVQRRTKALGTSLPVPPGVYFLRARSVGPGGMSAFGRVEVVDATGDQVAQGRA